MGIQSAVMAEQFGTMFQYGKRRISAMSNEDFNKLTPKFLQERMTKEIADMIPEMGKQIQAMQPMVTLIIKEFGEYIRLAFASLPEVARETVQQVSVTLAQDAGVSQSTIDAIAKILQSGIAGPIPQAFAEESVSSPLSTAIETTEVTPVFGPQPGVNPPATIESDTRIAPTVNPLQERQAQLEADGASIDAVKNEIKQLNIIAGQYHDKQVAAASARNYSLENYYRNKRAEIKAKVNVLLKKVLDLMNAYKTKYGVWYASTVDVGG